jgi:hypothetical protein
LLQTSELSKNGQSTAVLSAFAELEYQDLRYSEFFSFTCDLISKKKINVAERNSLVWMISGELSTWVLKF